jgi:hypothetical protein
LRNELREAVAERWVEFPPYGYKAPIDLGKIIYLTLRNRCCNHFIKILNKRTNRMFTEILHIPVIIDDVKKYDNFDMTRCVYFTIESDLPSPNWLLTFEGKNIPFYLLGLSGIIFKPFGEKDIFDSVDLIDDLFDSIEKNISLYVDTNDIWLPNFLFKRQERGQVYRINNNLFLKSYLYRDNKIPESEFISYCKEIPDGLHYSLTETKIFHDWMMKQIEEATRIYPKNKNMELNWYKL